LGSGAHWVDLDFLPGSFTLNLVNPCKAVINIEPSRISFFWGYSFMNVRSAVAWLLVVALTFGGSVSPNAFAQVPDHLPRVNLRGKEMLTCRTLVAPQLRGQRVNDSEGVVLSTGGVQEFKTSLKAWIAEHGTDSLRDQRIYVQGVSIQEERAVYKTYRAILDEAGLDPSTKLYVWGIRRDLLNEVAQKSIGDYMYRMRDIFFPNRKTQYQVPILKEAISAAVFSALVEIPTVVILAADTTMASPDKLAVLGAHFFTIFLYSVFTHTIRNWVMHPGDASGRVSATEAFIKQVLTTLPFPLYFIFLSQASRIAEVVHASGLGGIGQLFGDPLAIAVNVGVLSVLNALFYTFVVMDGFGPKIKGVGAWVNAAKGIQAQGTLDQRRVLAPLVLAIPLALDAAGFVLAGNNFAPITDIGLFHLDWGHVLIATFGVILSATFSKNPEIMNRVFDLQARIHAFGQLPVFKKFLDRVGATRSAIKKAIWIRGPNKDSQSRTRIRPLSLA
jgi:hypothetical protein